MADFLDPLPATPEMYEKRIEQLESALQGSRALVAEASETAWNEAIEAVVSLIQSHNRSDFDFLVAEIEELFRAPAAANSGDPDCLERP